jgi:hypothetical protein
VNENQSAKSAIKAEAGEAGEGTGSKTQKETKRRSRSVQREASPSHLTEEGHEAFISEAQASLLRRAQTEEQNHPERFAPGKK